MSLLPWLFMPVSNALADIETYVTSHHVVLWFHHSKIVLTYDDPADCPGCDVTTIDQNTTEGCLVACYDTSSCNHKAHCTTIGSGPADGDDDEWMLGEFNRRGDVYDELTSRPALINDANVVPKLLNALSAHGEEWTCLGDQNRKDERLDYDLLPEFSDGHNSNSFISGILRVADVDPYTVKPNRNLPGFRKHVDAERYSLDDPSNCE